MADKLSSHPIDEPHSESGSRDADDRRLLMNSSAAAIAGTIVEGIFLVEGSGTIAFANDSARQLFGVPDVALVGRHWTELKWYPAGVAGEEAFQPDLIETWLLEQRDYLRDLVWIIPHIDDVALDRMILVRFTPLESSDDAPATPGMVITFADHTARLRAQEELRVRESRFRALIENNPDPILLLSPTGEVLYATPSIPGWPAPALGSDVLTRIDPADRDTFRVRLVAAADSDAPPACFEVRTPHPADSGDPAQDILEVHLHSRLHDPAVAAVVANVRIITMRRQAEERQSASEQKYRLLFENNLAGVCRTTFDGNYIDCNDAYARIYGYANASEIMSGNASDRYPHPTVRENKLRLLRESGGRLSNCIAAGKHVTGREILLLENIALTREGTGREVIEGVVIDITPLHQGREDLARQNGILRSLIESIPDILFFKDTRGHFLGCNSAFEFCTGLKQGAVIGRLPGEICPDPDRLREILREDEVVARTREPLRVEKYLVRSDGRRCLVEWVLSPMFDDERQFLGIVGIGRDVTEQRDLARRLEGSARMESVGRLAGGIAHDFNNLLTVLMGNLGLVGLVSQSSPEYRTLIADCEGAVVRAESLTRQLLNYARQTPMEPTKLAIGPIVEETLGLLRRTINRNIALDANVPPDLWKVRGDRSQIGQILMNLCLNACDAMPKGGRLTVSTFDRTIVESAEPTPVPPGQYVLLEVSDDGRGISEEVRSHLFEPFYTTKPPGKGSGLGLAVVSGLVRQHDGFIECAEGPTSGTRSPGGATGHGTTFRVWLPRFEG